MTDIVNQQLAKCAAYNVQLFACIHSEMVGVAENINSDLLPVNALRIGPDGGATGWYIWAGEWSDDEEFFKPLHVDHLKAWCPQILPFLQFPPGWRVQLAPNHEDAWFDPTLDQ